LKGSDKLNDIKISPHFYLSEFESRDTKEVKISKELIDKLEILRDRLEGKPLYINSGYRTPEHNKAVGGADGSKHMEGIACDVRKVDGYSIDEMAEIAEDVGFTGIGKYDSFIHVDIRGHKARWDNRG